MERSPRVGGNKFIALLWFLASSGGYWGSQTAVGGSLAQVVGLEAVIEPPWSDTRSTSEYASTASASKTTLSFGGESREALLPVIFHQWHSYIRGLKVPLNLLKGFQNSGQRHLVFISNPGAFRKARGMPQTLWIAMAPICFDLETSNAIDDALTISLRRLENILLTENQLLTRYSKKA